MSRIKPLLGLARLGSTVLGGGLGAASAGPDESPLLRGLGGAVLGGVVGPGAVGSAVRGYRRGRAGGGTRATGLAEGLTEWTYFNYLGSPDTMARAFHGGIGGALIGALEDGIEGALRFDKELLQNSGRILKGVVGTGEDEGYKLFFKTLRQTPEEFTESFKALDPTLAKVDPEQYLRGESWLGRFFSASDMVANKALQAGGRTPREAARYTLTGNARSPIAKEVLRTQRKWKEGGPGQRIAANTLIPFARVSLLSAEKGLEHTPLLGTAMQRMYKTLDEKPIRKNIAEIVAKIKQNPTRPGYRAQLNDELLEEVQKLKEIRDSYPSALRQAIQQGLGVSAFLAGKEFGDRVDPRVGAVFAPLAGPTYLPFKAGQELAREQQKKGEDASWLTALTETAKEVSPLGHRPLGFLQGGGSGLQRELARRLVPSGVADVAEAMDPAFGRSAGPEEVRTAVERGDIQMPTLGTSPLAVAATSRLPWLREQLPEEFTPTDIFGAPRLNPAVLGDPWPVKNELLRGLSRATFPSRSTLMPPAINLSDPAQAIFRELGLSPGAPSTRVNIPGLDIPLKQTPESAAAVARHRGLARQITGMVLSNMPALTNMPDGLQKQILTKRITELLQRRITAALSAGTLPLSLAQGAQLPASLRQPQ